MKTLIVSSILMTALSACGELEQEGSIRNEVITLRSIPFDSGDVLSSIIQMCVQLDDDVLRSRYCRVDSNGKVIIPKFEYGNLGAADSNVYLDAEGALQRFETVGKSDELVALVALLTERYGKPRITVNEGNNMLGMKVQQQVYQWSDSRGTVLTVYSIYKSIDEGRVTIGSNSTVQVRRAADKVKGQEAREKL